jgi:glycosyltransferase involved in cell wall biosynthesis
VNSITQSPVRSSLRVSVVICAYTEERYGDLMEAIASVRSQSVPAYETVVVCDHNESLLERVRRDAPDVVAVPNAEQRGLSGARNSGIAAASGDVIAFLDDDAFADADWLEHLVAPYGDPLVLGVGGQVEPLWPDGHRPSAFPEEFDWVVGCTYRGMPQGLEPVRNMIGANMSLRRSVFDAVGTFTSGVGRVGTKPVGCEETELCIRARRRFPEASILYEPRARVRHRVTRVRASARYFRARCFAEGRSKAIVARLAGADQALATERTYVTRTLPRAVGRGLTGLVHGEPAGAARAAAVVFGLFTTAAGYALELAATVRQPIRNTE